MILQQHGLILNTFILKGLNGATLNSNRIELSHKASEIKFQNLNSIYTGKYRFNEWPPSAPILSLNRDFTLNRDFLK